MSPTRRDFLKGSAATGLLLSLGLGAESAQSAAGTANLSNFDFMFPGLPGFAPTGGVDMALSMLALTMVDNDETDTSLD
ncbi:MAG: twin-arginine translocation signal domain-containing protein, partial [Mycobacteriaceae bacterium]|nr:twin-arginine translocation signal domain-containing protein [Mycobacteriaceae bacterium]